MEIMISLCITTYQRTDMLWESFQQILLDDRISEIVIVDDRSSELIYEELVRMCSPHPKIRLYRNEKNLDCYRNKREAVSKASNEWVIIWDSDNVMTKKYIDVIMSSVQIGLYYNGKCVLQPSFASPHFDFRKYSGITITKSNIAQYMDDPTFETMLNAMNYFVNRDEYLRVWDRSVDPVTSDSLFHNYNWLKAGNSIYVVPGLEYEHRVHNDSHYRLNFRRTPHGFHKSIINKLKQLK